MSTTLCIFEDKKFANFLPLSLTRPVFDLRIGCGTLRSRLVEGIPRATVTLLCREDITEVTRIASAPLSVNDSVRGATLFLNGRLLCFGEERARLLASLKEDTVAVKGGYVVGARLSAAAAGAFADYLHSRLTAGEVDRVADALRESTETEKPRKRRSARGSAALAGAPENEQAIGQDDVAERLPVDLEAIFDAHSVRRVDAADARLLSFPWQLIEFNSAAIADDFERLPFRGQADDCIVYPGVHIVDPDRVVMGARAVVRAGAVLDASGGPIVIADHATIMPNATIIGPAFVGAGSLVRAGAKILEGTSIGPVCKVGGEVEETLFAAYSNKQHDGFIGNSYIGEWVNLGAATNNSDLKNNYSPVRMWCAGSMRETGRQFLGLVVGDHSKSGINTLFNTGTVVGFNCNVFSSELPSKFVPSFSWGHGEEMVRYEIEKGMQTALAVMERRKVKFTPAHQRLFRRILELCDRAGGNL